MLPACSSSSSGGGGTVALDATLESGAAAQRDREIGQESLNSLIQHVSRGGEIRRSTEEERSGFGRRVGEMLQLIVATPEYQYG